MDFDNIIVGIICTVICIVPFILLVRNRKKKEQQQFQSLVDLAESHGGRITNHEFSGNSGIAIDDKKGFVFFQKEINGETKGVFIDLIEIEECKLIDTRVSEMKNNENDVVIDRLEICFVPLSKSEKVVKLEIFNRDTNSQLYGELKFAEKWSRLINEQIQLKVW
ncbi:hypothetical protein SAMN06298216_0505 [Spirosomataceae bacterium TFI 002]|nr:hypothetical protein SAMN06298216_0505 [Spirosomataceae bacterium TFI 002]